MKDKEYNPARLINIAWFFAAFCIWIVVIAMISKHTDWYDGWLTPQEDFIVIEDATSSETKLMYYSDEGIAYDLGKGERPPQYQLELYDTIATHDVISFQAGEAIWISLEDDSKKIEELEELNRKLKAEIMALEFVIDQREKDYYKLLNKK